MLIGVGLGPGDPELLTLKAVEVLKNSDKVYVPGRLAKDLVAPYVDAEILEFPMIRDIEVLNTLWKENADKVAKEAKRRQWLSGLSATLTFLYLFSSKKGNA